MARRAQCSCGQLSITVAADPQRVVLCHCAQCQRRTGSVFSVAAYFGLDQIEGITGRDTAYRRTADSDRWAEAHFCPICGTTVYWQLEMWPDQYGVAVGCFTDPKFPSPQIAVWNVMRHDWVALPDGCRVLEEQR